jgi:hypothetical protein
MKSLVIPPAAQNDDSAVQLVSAWVASGDLHCALSIGRWHEGGSDEAALWGILLSDLARHAAKALQDKYGLDSPDTIARIRQAFDREFSDSTAETKGSFHHGQT